MNLFSLRKELKLKRLALDDNTLRNLSLIINKKFLSLDFIKDKTNFFIYNSIKNEVETAEIINCLLGQSKIISYPIIDGENLIPAIPTSTDFTLDCFGCKIPKDYTVMQKVEVAVIPLVACDKNKNRIGYGKGYYDRFLRDKTCIKVGLAYDFQVIDNITPNKWDVPLDYVITPTKIIKD